MPHLHIRSSAPAISALIAALCLGAVPAFAQPVSTQDENLAPPFAGVLARAQTQAPRLAEARARVDQARGLATQSRAWSNPTVSLESENFGGRAPFNGFGAAETTLSVEQPLELGGKRQARIAAGDAALQSSTVRATQTRGDFTFDLARAYVDAEAADRRLRLAEEALSLALDDERVARALVDAGKEADLRRLQAQSGVQAARAGLDEARAARITALTTLSAIVGEEIPYTAIPADLLPHADLGEAVIAPDPLQSPAYLSAEAERETLSKQVRVERTRAAPDVALSLGVRRLNGDDRTAFIGGVSLSLPLFDKSRGNISAAEADLTASQARLTAARRDAEAQSIAAVYQARAASSRLLAARDTERTAEETYRLTRLGYEGGKLPLSELVSARRDLIEARRQSLDARIDRLMAEALIARLTGAVPFADHGE
ncbi:hypothetical protein AEAC466_05485 [Asticcacaulis sp. AC466]|uniref:TolC family protein n=1 Tax=Asticcacaulis sp. AC466 TaxID=1282362 RepID=UPI0003C3BA45|nr:TolC family protein [Asticcacaulis sp. AC466]ESQ85162.1 hypothetical protein AEAC466_05485 [Asticcacaulis sp. AC466]